MVEVEGEVDLEDIEEALKRFRDDPRVGAALAIAAAEGEVVTTDGNREGVSGLSGYVESLDAELHAFEHENAKGYVESCSDLMGLHKEIMRADNALEEMESVLGAFQESLSEISSKIKTLQAESIYMNTQLVNRKNAHQVLETFIDKILVTPQLVHQICSEPVDEAYLSHLANLTKKLDHASHPRVATRFCCASSIPELNKLKVKAVIRIRNALTERINELKKPKTNVQILQQNVLIRYRHHYEFLAQHHVQSAFEVRQLYVQVLSQIYASQFRMYLQTLQRVQTDVSASKFDLLGTVDSGSHPGMAVNSAARALVGSLLGLGGMSEASTFQTKVGVFSLNNRDEILEDLDGAPLVRPVAAAQSQRFTYENIFRSHQKLLIDTASSEYFFLFDFFAASKHQQLLSVINPSRTSSQPSEHASIAQGAHSATASNASGAAPGGRPLVDGNGITITNSVRIGNNSTGQPEALFLDVFLKTLTFFLDSIEQNVEPTYDCICLLLLLRINNHNRLTMQRRQVPCLDTYLDKVHGLIWPRLIAVLTLNINSMVQALPSQLIEQHTAQQLQPHYVARRYAELASSLYVLSSQKAMALGGKEEEVQKALTQMQVAVENLIQSISRELPTKTERDRVVFRINNYDLILSVFNERRVSSEASVRFGDILRDQCGVYLESQLQVYFGDLIDFVRETELTLNSLPPPLMALSSSSTGTSEEGAEENEELRATRAVVDLQKMEQVVRKFHSKWKQAVASLRQTVMTSFTSFNNGLEILKQILTQLLLYHTRFQKLVFRTFPPEHPPQPPWVKDLVANNVILTEIRKHSQIL